MSNKAFLLAALALTIAFGISCEASAQRPLRPLKQLGRWSGDGLGNGYHWRNKGPNICYYNPYSAHNSQLISADTYSSAIVPAMDFAQPNIQQGAVPSIPGTDQSSDPVVRDRGLLPGLDRRRNDDQGN